MILLQYGQDVKTSTDFDIVTVAIYATAATAAFRLCGRYYNINFNE